LLASDQYISGEIDYFNKKPSIHHSIMREGCQIAGKVEHSVIGASVIVKPGAEIVNSVIMSGVVIGNNTKIYNAIIGKGSLIMDNTTIGVDYGVDFFVDPRLCTGNISVVEPGLIVPKEMIFCSGSHIDKDTLNVWSDLNEVGA
jgi:ADP-glucose pyrophosphorylase